MTESRFKQGQYEDALQFAKDVLSKSYSLNEIIMNSNLEEEKPYDVVNKLENE